MSLPSPSLPQADSAAAPDLAAQPRVSGLARVRVHLWDLPTRVFHWSLVGAVLTAVITGQIGGDWMPVHGKAGVAIVGLVVFRLIWGFIGSTHSRFLNFVPTPQKVLAYLRGRWDGIGHNPIGALSVFALLGLLAAQAGTGLFTNDDIAFSGPLAVLVSDALQSRLTGLHHLIANGLLIFLGLHVLAIAFYTWFKKDNLVKPMITGHKEIEAEDAHSHAPIRHGGWLAFLTALVAALAAVVLVSGVLLPQDPPAPATQQQAQPGW
jgi:cytochrome b